MARILLIDDMDSLRQSIAEILKSEGHEVMTSSGAIEAVRIFQSKGADLIITDMLMPDGDGIQAITGLRKIKPDIKIIATSGGGSINATDCLVWAEKLGADVVLRKPYQSQELLGAVEKLLA